MSRKQHEKQLARARARRRAARYDRRRGRARVLVLVMVALLVLGLVGTGLIGLLGNGGEPVVDDPPDDDPLEDLQPSAEPCPPADDAPAVDSDIYDEPPVVDLDPDMTYVATVETTCGAFEIELDVAGAPLATGNFVGLARDGYYDGVEFHRVIDGFVIQAGDPAGTGCGQEDCGPDFDPEAPTYPGYTFEDELDTAEALYEEAVIGYPRGTVAMANSGPDTNGSQFFVAQGDPTGLPDAIFTVLGEVVSGMEVVDQISGQATDPQDRPTEPVRIVDVTVDES